MDLRAIDPGPIAGQGANLHVCSANDEPLFDDVTTEPVTITLLGRDSKVFRDKQNDQNRVRLKRSIRKGKLREPDPEEIDRDSIELLVCCTKAWNHIIVDGETLECTPKNVRYVYKEFHFIREQVSSFVDDRENFLGEPSTDS